MIDQVQAERERIGAILDAGERANAMELALHLALDTRLAKQEALALLKEAIQPNNLFAEAMGYIENPDIGPDGGEEDATTASEAGRILHVMEKTKNVSDPK